MNKRKVWTVLSIGQLKRLLATAEALQRKHGVVHTDADCGVYTLSVNRDGQANFESVRGCASLQNYLPDNLMPSDIDPLMKYHGEFTSPPRKERGY